MRIRNGIFAVIVLITTALCGCTEQRDLDVMLSPQIKIKCDWSRARLNPDIWTVMFYGDNAAHPRQFVMERPVDTLQLSPDSYKTLIVNGTLGSGIDYIRFRGVDSYDTFEAYATVSQIRDDGAIVVNEPDTLAGTAVPKIIGGENKFTTKYDNGHLQPGESRFYVSDSIEYVPCRLVYRIKVTVTVNNINYLLASRKVTGEVQGLSGGVFVASRMPTHEPVIYSLIFTNNNPPSATVGNVETAFASFGPPLDLTEQRNYKLDLLFVLVNNRGYRITADVSNQVAGIAAKIKDRIDRGVCDAGLDLELKVTVTLPNPTPDTGEVEVDPWGDDEYEDIPLGL